MPQYRHATRLVLALTLVAAFPAAAHADATDVARKLATAAAHRDAHAAAALFAPDGSATLVGAGQARGQAAIARAFAALLTRYSDLRVEPGRAWLGARASVVELLLAGTRQATTTLGTPTPARPVGLVAGLVLTLDDQGRISALRLYLDGATLLGQVAPALLPAGMRARAVMVAPPAGRAVLRTRGTPEEARNLAATNAIWAALDAHHADAVMVSAAADYVYEDFAGPAPLDKAGTRDVVARLVAAVPDFVIADKPVQLAAGDEVVTEMLERGTFAGRPITLHGLDVKRFSAGQVIREWQYANSAEVMTQLLGAPAPPAY